MRLMEIFFGAIECTSSAERAAYLDRVCGNNSFIRKSVEDLLRSDATPQSEFAPAFEGQSFLDRPDSPAADKLATVFPNPSSGTWGRMGRYQLLQVLGHGGMGSVYRAEQFEPIHRLVALKIVKGGVSSKAILARFEAEQQVLARMEHPNIARVLDVGTFEPIAGNIPTPFIVMELVDGIPITEYCDLNRLTIRQRLELFVPVCQAIQHAHQKGIIHRDVKPSNVLVTNTDGGPVPKVIDFGVAKSIGESLLDTPFTTGFGVIGTPEYMSPEQAGLNGADVDTRSDVYSLGVLLFELLTGSTPIDNCGRGGLPPLEILHLVRDSDAPRPSDRVTGAANLSTIAANRGIEPRKLSSILRNELDWILLKALEKDPRRRYDTADGLARDIQRFLTNDVVEARPPTRGYRLRKFVRRNRTQVFAAGFVATALIAGTTVSVWQAIRAMTAEGVTAVQLKKTENAEELAREEANRAKQAEAFARREAERAKGAEETALVREKEARAAAALADKRAREATEATADARAFGDFLSFNFLAATRPLGHQGGIGVDVKMSEVLAKAEADIPRVFLGRERAEGQARLDVGITWRNLGQYDRAEANLRRALQLFERKLGPDNVETLEASQSLGITLLQKQDRTAEPYLRRAMEGFEKLFGPDDERVLQLAFNLTSLSSDPADSTAREAYRRALVIRETKLGKNHTLTLHVVARLAKLHLDRMEWADAEPLIRRAITALENSNSLDNTVMLIVQCMLGEYLMQARGDFAAAEVVYKRSVAGMEKVYGPDHPETLTAVRSLGVIRRRLGDPREGEALLRRALAGHEKSYGPNHPETLGTAADLADLLLSRRELPEAELLMRRALVGLEKLIGTDHTRTLRCVNSLANMSFLKDDLVTAERLFQRALAGQERAFGANHPNVLVCVANLAAISWRRGDYDRSIPLLERVLQGHTASFGPNHPILAQDAFNLGVNYQDGGRSREAIPYLERVEAAWKTMPRPDYLADDLTERLTRAYRSAGRPADAVRLVRRDLDAARQKVKPGSPDLARRLARAGELLLDVEPAAAEAILRECLTIREKQDPSTWMAAHARVLLGAALMRQRKAAQAERFLLDGYAGLKANVGDLPPSDAGRLPQALDELIRLAGVMRKPDDAEKWRAERAKYPLETAPKPRRKAELAPHPRPPVTEPAAPR